MLGVLCVCVVCVCCVCVLCVLVWGVVPSSLPAPPPGCGNLEIRPSISSRAGEGKAKGKSGGDPRRAPGVGIYTHDGPSVRMDPEARAARAPGAIQPAEAGRPPHHMV